MFLNTLTKKIEANCKLKIFCTGIRNLLFDRVAYNTSGHFAHCSYFSSPLKGSEKYHATRKISARIICLTMEYGVFIDFDISPLHITGLKSSVINGEKREPCNA